MKIFSYELCKCTTRSINVIIYSPGVKQKPSENENKDIRRNEFFIKGHDKNVD